MSVSNKYYAEIFDFLSAPIQPTEALPIVAFGRKDLLVAKKVVDLHQQSFAEYVVISGGIGKDSGDLQIAEAEYLTQGATEISHQRGLALPPLFIETAARNGADNARNSMLLMDRGHLDYSHGLTTVAHATSSRRLHAGMEHEAIVRGTPLVMINRVPTDYSFDPTNPIDQLEARAEILRLHEWPTKGWLQPQPELPARLVDFALDVRDEG